MCVVFQRKGKAYFQSTDLHPRWKVENHPLWRLAHRNLCISLPEEIQDNFAHGDVSNQVDDKSILVSKDAFDKIKIPKAPHARYGKLKVVFEHIAKFAVNCPVTYRHVFAMLMKEENYCRNRCSGDADVVSDEWFAKGTNEIDKEQISNVLPPLSKVARKRARTTKDDVANQSLLKKTNLPVASAAEKRIVKNNVASQSKK